MFSGITRGSVQETEFVDKLVSGFYCDYICKCLRNKIEEKGQQLPMISFGKLVPASGISGTVGRGECSVTCFLVSNRSALEISWAEGWKWTCLFRLKRSVIVREAIDLNVNQTMIK